MKLRGVIRLQAGLHFFLQSIDSNRTAFSESAIPVRREGIRKYIYIGLVSGLIACLFGLLPWAELFELKGYDLLHRFRQPLVPPRDIIIVAIDEPSFAEIGKQWPWPRSLHAKLIDALRKQGASVIGMDVIFSESSRDEEDKALLRAIQIAGNVVLAADIEIKRDRTFDQEMHIEPLSIFREKAFTGLATIVVDRDGVVRKTFPTDNNETLFAEQVAAIASGKRCKVPDHAYISYFGPPASFRTVSYYQALESSHFLPADSFKGKIVLVGKAIRTTPEPGIQGADLFATPFLFSRESGLMNGVEIQANVINNLLSNTFIRRLKRTETILLLFITGMLCSLLQMRWRPAASGLRTLIFLVGYLTAAYLMFDKYHIWIPTFLAILPITLPYGIFGVHAYLQSEHQRREIKRAFAHYVSPSVLETILANPADLKLGGKKGEVTILFSDIAGFTTISEKLPPEDVARLLSRYLDEMSKIIFEHRGTVDKFIGDAIMAFWGAPLPDPDHAFHACSAAVAMQKRLRELRVEFRERGMPEIDSRIGINSGEVVVGNMGSSALFNYTVIGDPVNLASRLEGANKEFGTSIIISKNVHDKISARSAAHYLGNIQVKGKQEHIDVYELTDMRP